MIIFTVILLVMCNIANICDSIKLNFYLDVNFLKEYSFHFHMVKLMSLSVSAWLSSNVFILSDLNSRSKNGI